MKKIILAPNEEIEIINIDDAENSIIIENKEMNGLRVFTN